MSSTARRDYFASEDNDNHFAKSHKEKAKINCISPKSKLFSAETDHLQFENIYKCLYNELKLQPLIAKDIAEFATGNIEKCQNYTYCSNHVHTLYQHKYLRNRLLDYFRYIDHQNNGKELLFCDECSSNIQYCDRKIGVHKYCALPFNPLKQNKCKCGDIINYGCYKHTKHCKLCEMPICSKARCRFHDGLICCIECKLSKPKCT